MHAQMTLQSNNAMLGNASLALDLPGASMTKWAGSLKMAQRFFHHSCAIFLSLWSSR